MAPSHVRIVAADTSVLINFLNVERLDLLERLPGYSFSASEHVVAEVTNPSHASRLKTSIDNGHIRVIQMTDSQEIAQYAALRKLMDNGEAASLAIAHSRNWFVACDEKRRFLRQADATIGIKRVLNTPTLIVIAIISGLLTVAKADQIKVKLEKRRFRIKAASFSDLLPPHTRRS